MPLAGWLRLARCRSERRGHDCDKGVGGNRRRDRRHMIGRRRRNAVCRPQLFTLLALPFGFRQVGSLALNASASSLAEAASIHALRQNGSVPRRWNEREPRAAVAPTVARAACNSWRVLLAQLR